MIGLFGEALGVNRFVTLTSFTMGFMVLGYIGGIFLIPRVLSQSAALTASAVVGLACTAGAWLSDPGSQAISAAIWGWTGLRPLPDPIFFVAAMGLANALVWPTVWPLALSGLGRFTATGSALLIMAISGGAIIPPVFGWLASTLGDMQPAYLVAVPCYLMILFYAMRGHRIRQW
jgi:fucose permease